MMLHQQTRKLLLVIVLVLSPSVLLAAEKPMPVSYDLKVTINPALGTIGVRGRIEVPLKDSRSPDLDFALHETFAIQRLSVNGQEANFTLQPGTTAPFNPATGTVVVRLPPHIGQSKIAMDIEYEGRLKDIPEFGTYPDQKQALDDQINARLVELASYSSWYPQFFDFGYPLQIELEVSLPSGWVAVCSGKKLEDAVRDGRAITRWSSSQDEDIVISAAPNYRQKSVRVGDLAIEIYYTQLPEAFIESEGRQIAAVMKLFTDLLGETTIPAGTVKHVYSPMRKGQGRAGIARPGMIVTSEGRTLEALAADPKFSLFQDIAHEIAHFWWNFGAAQGDWINEAFAEYFSALAVEKVVSEEQFESVLENYRKEVKALPQDAPSLSTVPADGSWFVVRYYKGSLMLDFLRRALGDERFFEATRDFFQTYREQSVGTAEFRNFWKPRLGDRKEALDVWLNSGGGLPSSERRGNVAGQRRPVLAVCGL
jgi:Peptidase family M1 domain